MGYTSGLKRKLRWLVVVLAFPFGALSSLREKGVTWPSSLLPQKVVMLLTTIIDWCLSVQEVVLGLPWLLSAFFSWGLPILVIAIPLLVLLIHLLRVGWDYVAGLATRGKVNGKNFDLLQRLKQPPLHFSSFWTWLYRMLIQYLGLLIWFVCHCWFFLLEVYLSSRLGRWLTAQAWSLVCEYEWPMPEFLDAPMAWLCPNKFGGT